MIDRIAELRAEGEAAIAEASGTDALEQARVRFLGRKAELPNMLRGVAQLPPEERGAVGRAANEARRALEAAVEDRKAELERSELDARLAADVLDVTLPGTPAVPVGRLHLVSATRRELEDAFLGLGFRVVEGPEIDTVYYNFDALNHDAVHPSRLPSDTFYVDEDIVLRTHTSPMQIRAMETHPAPLYIVIPGRTYRRDNDRTHTPQFHQLEGLVVDKHVSVAHLIHSMKTLLRGIFRKDVEVRLRPGFFPFVEPGFELDARCPFCTSGCSVCKQSRWIELLPCGLVHPNVLRYSGVDADEWSGFAFGLGLSRLVMLRFGITDVRLLLSGDLRFLEQF